MHDHTLVMARPKGCNQLVLLFQGVGSSAHDLVTLGQVVDRAVQIFGGMG
jgi:predicted esterase